MEAKKRVSAPTQMLHHGLIMFYSHAITLQADADHTCLVVHGGAAPAMFDFISDSVGSRGAELQQAAGGRQRRV